MARIEYLEVLDNYLIRFQFVDGLEKTVDFKPYIKEDSLTKPLSDFNYFKQVSIYQYGSGIYWPNGYDFDPSYLRNYVAAASLEQV